MKMKSGPKWGRFFAFKRGYKRIPPLRRRVPLLAAAKEPKRRFWWGPFGLQSQPAGKT